MTEIINGKILATAIREKAAARIKKLAHPPGLAVIIVGENPASQLYVNLKESAAKEVGIYVERIELPAETDTKTLCDTVRSLNERKEIHGILLQLPLPKKQNVDEIIQTILPEKDVDGFHPHNRELLQSGTPAIVPPTALAVMRLLQATRIPLNGKHAVILGNSSTFAEPIILLMRDAGIIATFVPKETEGLETITRTADILVSAVGSAHMLTKDMLKPSAVVIDVGTSKTPEGKLAGDAHPDLVGFVGFLTPVPGGVGPLTVAYLLMNVIKARELQEKKRDE